LTKKSRYDRKKSQKQAKLITAKMKEAIIKWQSALLFSLISAAVVFSVSAVVPPTYKSQFSMLIGLKDFSGRQDLSASTNYLGQSAIEIANSTVFLDEINVYSSLIQSDPEKALKDWRKQVKISKKNDSGLLVFEIYGKNKNQTLALASEISKKIPGKFSQYLGDSQKVELNLLSGPFANNYPAKPNVFLNTIIGFLVGLAGYFLLSNFWGFELNFKKTANKPSFISNRIKKQFSGDVVSSFFSGEIYPIRGMKKDVDKEREKEGKKENVIQEEEKSVEFVKPAANSSKKEIQTFIEGDSEPEKSESASFPISKETKSSAPGNLPFIDPEGQMPWAVTEKKQVFKKDDFVSLDELEKEKAKEKEQTDPTEEEIKERLNKLLRGDL
jgi:capsular polysaccharide biosynthesis protein